MCADYANKQPSGQLKPTIPLTLLWKKFGADLFEFRGEHNLLSVCYRSTFPEVTKLESLRSSAVVEEIRRDSLAFIVTPQKWFQTMAPSSLAVNFKSLQRIMASSKQPAHHITLRPTERLERPREPFKR